MYYTLKRKEKWWTHSKKFHIYKETKLENQINDKNTIKQNILFDTIIQKHKTRGNPSLPTQPEQH